MQSLYFSEILDLLKTSVALENLAFFSLKKGFGEDAES